jgi:hypothetical protein
MRNERIFAKPEFTAGKEIYLQVSPDPGYILKEGSLKYTDSAGETAVDEGGKTFIMPENHVTIAVEIKLFTAMENLKINNRTLGTPAAGKTDYTVWIPGQDTEALFSFNISANAEAVPKSGIKYPLKLFAPWCSTTVNKLRVCILEKKEWG